MSNIKDETGGLNARDIAMISDKRIVFIVDEAHRSTFGDMLITIKNTFPKAMFFGFTGTPIQDENRKKKNTTTTVFGNGQRGTRLIRLNFLISTVRMPRDGICFIHHLHGHLRSLMKTV